MRNRDPFYFLKICAKCGLTSNKLAVKPGIVCKECADELGPADEPIAERVEPNFNLTKEEEE